MERSIGGRAVSASRLLRQLDRCTSSTEANVWAIYVHHQSPNDGISAPPSCAQLAEVDGDDEGGGDVDDHD
jgi:hypothetical protein